MQGIREAELVLGAQCTEFCLSGIHSDPQKERASIIMGSFQIRCGARKQEAGGRKQEAGGMKQEVGGRKQETEGLYAFKRFTTCNVSKRGCWVKQDFVI